MYTKLQQLVIDRAKEKLCGKPVCLDQLPGDNEIRMDGVEDWADTLVLDTHYWDGTLPGAR